MKIIEVKAPWGEALDPETIAEALKSHPDAKAVAVVHSETSTTILNPIAEIGRVVSATQAIFLVDAVSSLGGVPLNVDNWAIDLCPSASQKCLGATPGVAPVAVSKKAWSLIDRPNSGGHGWYVDFRVWRHYAEDWGDWHPTPVTMPVSIANGLLVSLEQLLAEGIDKRMLRYRELALRLRDGLRDAGMQPFTPDEVLNPVLTAAYPPAGINSGKVVEYLLEKHHIQISGGLGELKPKIFRIGHMSPVISDADMDELVAALKSFR